MHILVAGGHGFIGRHVAAALAQRGHRVTASGSDDTAAVAGAGFEALVWCGGRRGGDPDALRGAHVDAPLAALGASRARTIVYLGSGECYGAVEPPFREESPLLGVSPYARAKIDAERALASWATERPADRRVTMLRLGVVYGPGQAGTMLVPSLVAALRERQPFPATTGEQTRDLVAVEDVARAVCACLVARGVAASHADAWRAFNIGSGRETRVADLFEAVVASVARQTGEPLDGLRSLVQRGAIPYRAGEQMRYLLAIERAASELGWYPECSLEAGLADTVRAAFARP